MHLQPACLPWTQVVHVQMSLAMSQGSLVSLVPPVLQLMARHAVRLCDRREMLGQRPARGQRGVIVHVSHALRA